MPDYPAQGPTTGTAPYLVATQPGLAFSAIAAAGDAIGTRADGTPSLFAGKPDGLGAFDNGDGTITVLVNHELERSAGIVRAHGSTGAFIDRLIVDKATLAILASQDLVEQVALYDRSAHAFALTTTAFGNLCAGDLPDPSAFYDSATGLGTQSRIFLSGEEAGAEGRAFAFVASGAEAGTAYELPWLGRFSYEDILAAPGSGTRTVVIGTQDEGPAQLYVYVGDKQAGGSAVDQAGLTNGLLYGVKVEGLALEGGTAIVPGGQAKFILAPLGDVSDRSGAALESDSDAAGVTEFIRIEDGAWDPTNPNAFYFVGPGGPAGPSRLYRLDFYDVSNPTLGGEITILLDGGEGHKALDNVEVTDEGLLILQEDPGSSSRLAKIWQYDPFNDRLTQLAEHDPDRFGPEASQPLTQNEESSGVIDVSRLLSTGGEKTFLLDVQAHYAVADPRVIEGGQLLAMTIALAAAPLPDGHGRFAVAEAEAGEADAGDARQIVFTVSRIEGSVGAASVDYRVSFLAGRASAGDFAADAALTGTVSFAAGETSKTISLALAGDGAFEGDERFGIVLFHALGANGVADPVALGTIVDDEGLSLTGSGGPDRLVGAGRDDALAGLGGDDLLEGGAGGDGLDGGAGADRMIGGDGDDTYFVDNAADKVIETSPAGGMDTVRSSVSFSLGGRYIETLVLTGEDAVDATGNGLANILTGNDAANVLNGGEGADRMTGGGGDDIYFVDNEGDKVVETSPAGGIDTVRSSVSFSLGGRYIETLVLTGNGAIDGNGNGLANTLIGNSAANRLEGGAGADRMEGGGGDDLFYVDDPLDKVVETIGNGTDTLRSSVSFSLAGQYVEKLVLTGSAAKGVGNGLDNVIIGNAAGNKLDGADGNDHLYGGGGNDILHGGAGADSFHFDTAPDATANFDKIYDFSAADDTILLDRSLFAGLAADGVLDPSAFVNGAAAQDADDRILYDAANGNIFYDADGNGSAAAILFAQVTAGTALTYLDFSAYMPGA